jgi:hypothetical protein
MRPISEVNVGDEVATTNPQTGANSDQQVTLLHANRDTELTDVTVSTAPAVADRTEGEGRGGRSTRGPTEVVLETTAHHPFWDATTGEWIDASDLTPGTSTLVGLDGQIQYVTAVRNFTGSKVMRDLTVATTHTYYVIAGNEPVLVHNNNNCPDLFDEFGVTPGQGFDASVPSAGDKSFITYAFRNQAGEVSYVGRASGAGNPAQVLVGRLSRGHDHFKEGLTPEVIAVQKTYASNRGAEEFFIAGFLQRGAKLTNADPAVGFSKPARGRKSVGYVDAFFTELMG